MLTHFRERCRGGVRSICSAEIMRENALGRKRPNMGTWEGEDKDKYRVRYIM